MSTSNKSCKNNVWRLSIVDHLWVSLKRLGIEPEWVQYGLCELHEPWRLFSAADSLTDSLVTYSDWSQKILWNKCEQDNLTSSGQLCISSPSLSLSQVPQQGEGDSRRQLHILVQLGTSRWAGGGQERAPGVSCWGNTPHGHKRCSSCCTMSRHPSLPLPLPLPLLLRSMVVTYHNGRDSFSTPGRPSPHQASQTEPPLNQLCLSILNLTFSYQFSLKYF